MKKIYNSFLTTLGLICRVPIPLKYKINFSFFPFFFPLVGIIASFWVLGIYTLSNSIFRLTGITVIIILFLQYLVFNLFHFDGLLDCADAFLFNTSKERRLSILTDKRTGSFAIFSGGIYLLLKFYLINESISILNSSNLGLLWVVVLFFYPLSGRIAGAIMPALIPPAEDPGLAELLKGYSKVLVISGITLSLLVFLGSIFLLTDNLLSIATIFIPFSGAFAGGIAVSLLSYKLVGGYTGDSIGLTIETGELFYLIITAELLRRLF